MDKVNFIGKHIIFFSPNFFGYEDRIKHELEEMGATVFHHSDRAGESFWIKVLTRIYPKLLWPLSDFVFTQWLNKRSITKCDIVFIIKGEGISPAFVKELRLRYPHARLVNYQWDSVANVKYAESKFSLFDHVASFDPDDCKRLSFVDFQPTFYSCKVCPIIRNGKMNRIFFVGTLNGDRPRVVANFIRCIGANLKFDYSLFVRSKLELVLRKVVDPSFKVLDESRLVFKPVSVEEIAQRMDDCGVILDVQNHNQTGLTLRVFDALATGRKIITTNNAIAMHDFYDPKRICIIDRNNPEIPENFFGSIPKKLPDYFFRKYSMRGWLIRIMK